MTKPERSPLLEAVLTAPGVILAQRGIVRKVAGGVVSVMALAGYCLMWPLFEGERRGWW